MNIDNERQGSERIQEEHVLTFKNVQDGHGTILLDKLADPGSVVVTMYNEPVVTHTFDDLGQPIFTKEQCEICSAKAKIHKKEAKGTGQVLLQVSYVEREFNVPRDEFDTIESVRDSTRSLFSFENLLRQRREFHKATGKRLNEFLVFGLYKLTAFGEITLSETEFGSPVKFDVDDVVEFTDDLLADKKGVVFFRAHSRIIPKPGTACPYCGHTLSIDDVKNQLLSGFSFAHTKCEESSRADSKLAEIYDIIDRLYPNNRHLKVYFATDHVMKHSFQTEDGNIMFYWNDGVFTVEWCTNYLPFETDGIRYIIGGACLQEDGKRRIVRTGSSKLAWLCLLKARNSINRN